VINEAAELDLTLDLETTLSVTNKQSALQRMTLFAVGRE
jgi:hypothetical protein